MKSILSTTAMTLMACAGVFAQYAGIEGKILQADSISALPGVSVYLDNTQHGAASNGNGNYAIDNVPAGNYTLVASAIGYLTVKKEITVVAGENVKADFILTESISTLSEVTIMTGGYMGLKDLPGSAYYLSPREIQKFNYTDVNRTLREVPGVNVQEEDGFGLRTNIGFRGTDVLRSAAITVMEDGVLMAPAPYAASAAYYFPTVGRMQGIEILKGSSQIKYGPYTTGGAINLISTQIPDGFSGRINMLGGSFGGRNLHAFAGNSGKHIGYLVETFQYSSDGFKRLDGGGNTGFDKKDYLAKFRINTGPDTKIYQSLTFKIGQSTEISNETYFGLTDDDFKATPYRRYAASQKDQMNTKQTQFSMTYMAELSKFVKVTTTAYRNDFHRNWYKLAAIVFQDSAGVENEIEISDEISEDAYSQFGQTAYNEIYGVITGSENSAADALEVKANNRTYYAQGVQSIVTFNYKTGAMSHLLNIGFRLHRDELDRFQWLDKYRMDQGVMELTTAGIPGTESNRIESADALAAYLQYKLKYKGLTVTPGFRYENITLARKDYGKNDIERTGSDLSERSNAVDVLIPGVGVDYSFNKNLSAFAGVHKGFSPPGSSEGAQPESSINYETGIRYGKDALSGQIVGFFNDYSNLLGADLAAAGGSGSGDLYNGGAAQSEGIELKAGYDLLASKSHRFNLPVSIAYTYTDAVFKSSFSSGFEGWGSVESGDELPYLANNQFAFSMGLEHKRFGLNVGGKYTGAMRTKPGKGSVLPNETTDARMIVDASANYMLHKSVTLFASATNLADEVYIVARRPAGLRPGMPRAFNIGLKAVF